ncbi:MAG: pantoate--beta-alanine ligase, partial [Candidatus Omnitrophica bacterium]|nr:pantoate--beta-alanine ligase [Candidatus Omnitrophota bacterium]
SLIRKARGENDAVVVSIFVNPAQFGPHEDLARYPRPFARDARLCRREGVDVIFFPQAPAMYPPGYRTYVNVDGLSEVLCGRSRKGHFRGVATVVNKLFNIVGPDIAYFGQKDAQQALILRKMAEDLNLPVKIRVLAIVRDADGLALSSRNAYLSAAQRREALVLVQALRLARRMSAHGMRDAAKITAGMKRLISGKKRCRIDYVALVDPRTLAPVKRIDRASLALLAVRVGKTRLIDNMALKPSKSYAKN